MDFILNVTNGYKELLFHPKEITCHNVNLLNISEQCAFVRANDTCVYDGIFYSYTELTYCQLVHFRWAAILMLLSILFMLFVSIGSVADDFLCPSLLTISKTFRLPDHIAGVTFLALGNGAPDIFASYSGITQTKPQLIFSSLFGAGIFVSTVVAGSVLVTGEFNVMRRPIMRDIIFYTGAAYLVWVFIFHGTLSIKHSISFLAYYLVYISVIIISRLIYVKWSSQTNDENEDEEATDEEGPIEIISNGAANGAVPPPTMLVNGISPMASPIASPMVTPRASPLPSAASSRRQSVASAKSDIRRRTTSYDDDVILTRFYRRGTLRTPRNRSHSELRYHAHHHLENSIYKITQNYEARRKLERDIEDVRYKKTIEKEKEKAAQRAARLAAAQESQKRIGYANDITFTNNFERPKYFAQMSTASLWSTQTLTEAFSEGKDFLIHVSPVDILEWKNYAWYRMVLELVKAIPYFIMTVCIPVVDLESPNENWCRLLICLNVICAPQVVLYLTKVDVSIGGHFPLWAVCLVVSPILSLIIFFTSRKDQPPVYHRVFGFIGFGISVIFVNTIASEVIAVLTTAGVIFDLSDSILGLTVLAWGNSLGDLISDVSMARHGYPGMAISACFGGPMMNLLMGLGLPYTLMFLSGEHHHHAHIVEYTPMMTLLFATLMTSLVSSLFIFVFNRFQSSRYHGIGLIAVYLSYLCLAMLIEFNVIGSQSD